MGTTLGPLAAQRLLLAGLAAAAVLSALLLWSLRASPDRGRGARPAPDAGVALVPSTPDSPQALSTPGSVFRAPLGERSEPFPDPPSSDAVAAESFDPRGIYGRVLCEGEPVPEVELRLFDGTLERRERGRPLAETRSDAEGRFRFHGLAPHVGHALCAQHPDFLPEEETFFAGHAAELELEPAVTVAGTVRAAASREPLAGVEVALERWHFAQAGTTPRLGSVTDAEGRWQLLWAEPGIERFLVLRPGFLPERREFQVGPEGGDGHEILLGEGRVLELELYELESGALLAEREVLADDVRVRTDPRGRLRLPIPSSEESVRVSLALEGGCLTQGRVQPPGSGATASGVAPSALRVPLAQGGRVRGRVLDGAGRPIAAAEVRLTGGGRAPAGLPLPEGFWLNPPRAVQRSGADGAFELRGQPPRTELVALRARHPEHPPGRSAPFEFALLGASQEHDVVLEQGGVVTGEVRLDGSPAALRVHWTGERDSGWTRANDRGQYRIAGIPSGEVSLRPRLDDEDEELPRPEDRVLRLEEGAEVTLDLDLASRRAHIRGRVLDTHGAAVAGAHVWAEPQAEEEWEAEEPSGESGPDGSFTLSVPDAPALLFEVWVESGPRRAWAGPVRAGEDRLVLELPALKALLLRVVDSLRREPVQGFQLYWRLADEGRFERLVQDGRRFSPGPDGIFRAELPVGRLDLVVSARSQGYVPVRQDGVDLLGSATPLLEFELERGVTLELELVPAPEAGEALRALQRGRTAIVSLDQWASRERGGAYFQQEVRGHQALRPDRNAVARVEALESGRYRFLDPPKGFVLRPKEFELPPVAEHRLRVTLEPEPRPQEKPGPDRR